MIVGLSTTYQNKQQQNVLTVNATRVSDLRMREFSDIGVCNRQDSFCVSSKPSSSVS